MIGKLLKHEMKATYKVFLLVYFLVFLICSTMMIGGSIGSEYLLLFSTSIMGLAVLPVIIVYFMMVERRFYKGLYGSEGYLMFTLPVKSWEIVLSKWLVASFWGIMTVIAAILATIILLGSINANNGYTTYFYQELFTILKRAGIANILRFLGIIFVSGMNLIAVIYFSIAVGYLPEIRRLNGLVGVIVFYLIMKIQNLIFNLLPTSSSPLLHYSYRHGMQMTGAESVDLYLCVAFLLSMLLLAGVIGILSKKVSLK